MDRSIIGMKNMFIRQFGKPEGKTGVFLGKIMAVSNRKMHRAVMSYMKMPERVLEIGTGTGSQLEMLSRKFTDAELFGIDISEDMVRAAKKSLGTKANISLGSIEQNDFDDDFFDTVITTDTCYFWKDTAKALNEIRRILKTDGTLIIAYNSMYAGFVHRSDNNCKMYDDSSVIHCVEAAGMRLLRQKRCGLMQKVFEIMIGRG